MTHQFVTLDLPSRYGFNTLSHDHFEKIHDATTSVLKKTGVFVESDTAREILGDAGCRIDLKEKIVRIPPAVVESAIISSPSEFLLSGRVPSEDVLIGINENYFSNFSSNVNMVDIQSGMVRKSTKQDLADATRICFGLKNLDIYSRAVYPLDVPPKLMHLHTADACLRNTTKHTIHGPENRWQTQKIIEMAQVVIGGSENLKKRKPISFVASIVSPLKMTAGCSDVIMTSAKNGFSTIVASAAMGGGTAPVHLAGLLVQTNAEVMAGLVLTQLVNKGAPFIYANYSTAMDLKLASSPFGSPEAAILTSTVSNLCKYYQIPCSVPGVATDSKQSGAQAAHEKTLTGLATTMAGADIIFGAGGMETGMTFDPVLAVIDDEMIRMIRQFKSGMTISDETLSVDIIDEIGHTGNYLMHPSTFSNMKSGSQPSIFNRYTRDVWNKKGGESSYLKAREKVEYLIKNGAPEPLCQSVISQLDDIIEGAEKEVNIPMAV